MKKRNNTAWSEYSRRAPIGKFVGESTNGGLSQNTNLLHNALNPLKVELSWQQGLSVDEV